MHTGFDYFLSRLRKSRSLLLVSVALGDYSTQSLEIAPSGDGREWVVGMRWIIENCPAAMRGRQTGGVTGQ